MVSVCTGAPLGPESVTSIEWSDDFSDEGVDFSDNVVGPQGVVSGEKDDAGIPLDISQIDNRSEILMAK